MKKKLPIGVNRFDELQEDNYYVVDKTLMIHEFMVRGSKVTLITRPRRFGKTLNMSMMAEFFDIRKDSRKLFQDTNIAKTDYYKEMNQYPVIYVSFANCKGEYEAMKKKLFETIRLEYARFQSYFTSDETDKDIYVEVRKVYQALKDANDLIAIDTAIKTLSQFLYEISNKRVMIFIDEYDTPFISAHEQGYYQEIKGVLSSLLHSALKDNEYLQHAMLTGIQRVAKENIFSDLNNLAVFTVKDAEYAQYFGFTTQETKTLLEYYDVVLNDDVKAMYDGYNMGGTEIYNPWSIINYAEKKELLAFWVNTSSNTMIKEIMKSSDDSFRKDYEELIQADYIDVQASLSTSFYEVRDNSNLWGLFVNAGFLTIEKTIDLEDEVLRLRIPNREVLREFKSLTASYLQVSTTELRKLYDGIMNKDAEKFIFAYRFLLINNPSYYDLKSENSYHMFLLGICLYLHNNYDVLSNREVGNGRCDIILKAKIKELPSYVIEFKYAKTETNLKQLASQAVDQIKERKYNHNLQGDVIFVGLAHYGKEVEMEWVEV